MRVALICSDREQCGIREYGNMMQESVCVADPSISFVQDPAWVDPEAFYRTAPVVDLLVINYHRGLHSRWTPRYVGECRPPCVIVFHDSYTVQPDSLPWDLLQVCDAMVVHEPCDLSDGIRDQERTTLTDAQLTPLVWERRQKVHYWRQGVPQPSGMAGRRVTEMDVRPYVGTCGFAFPWKGFELLCEAAAKVGWGVLILSNNATAEQADSWMKLNPWCKVRTGFQERQQIIANLKECDATAFMYSCSNSGTSGAIRLGIAAGKPLLANGACRQMRDLYLLDEEEPTTGIRWTHPEVSTVAKTLSGLLLERFNPGIVALRERDSWRHLGTKYAALYRSITSAAQL